MISRSSPCSPEQNSHTAGQNGKPSGQRPARQGGALASIQCQCRETAEDPTEKNYIPCICIYIYTHGHPL